MFTWKPAFSLWHIVSSAFSWRMLIWHPSSSNSPISAISQDQCNHHAQQIVLKWLRGASSYRDCFSKKKKKKRNSRATEIQQYGFLFHWQKFCLVPLGYSTLFENRLHVCWVLLVLVACPLNFNIKLSKSLQSNLLGIAVSLTVPEWTDEFHAMTN